jgi:phage terminase small subunit
MTTKKTSSKRVAKKKEPKDFKKVLEELGIKPTKEAVKFPPPKLEPIYVKMWNMLLPELVQRKKFKEVHLHQLEMLCEMYVDHEQLSEFIRKNGHSYKLHGINSGHRAYPQVAQLNKVRTEIRYYSTLLGLVISRGEDASKAVDFDSEEDRDEAWE